MIRHIWMYKLKENNKEEGRIKFFEKAEKLRKLDIIKRFDIVRNEDSDSNYDVALILDFDTVEALDEYQKSQQHMEFGEFVYSIKVR